jgi:hypothetical protein
MFEGFAEHELETDRGVIFARVGGSGPPLLVLHGYPQTHLMGLGGEAGRYPADLIAAYRRLLEDPSIVEAICEDYRAGAGVDRDHDDADLGTRRIQCPVLALWSARGALPRLYGDVLEVWRPWTADVTAAASTPATSLSKTAPRRSPTHSRRSSARTLPPRSAVTNTPGGPAVSTDAKPSQARSRATTR